MNGENKANKINGKDNEQKVIPKDVWKDFAEFWDATEWIDLKPADIKKHLGNGKYLFIPIPKDVTSKVVGKAWYNNMAQFREKKEGGFGNITICFAGQKATLEQVFGDKPLNYAQMTKQLHLYVNDHHLSSKQPEPKPETKPKPKVEPKPKAENKNGKNTVHVNTVEEMEKEVAKLNPKNSKKGSGTIKK